MHTPDGLIERGTSTIDGKAWGRMKKLPAVAKALESGRLVEGDEEKAAKVADQKEVEAAKADDAKRKKQAPKKVVKKKKTARR